MLIKLRIAMFLVLPAVFFTFMPVAQAQSLSTLKSYWHNKRIDYFSTATKMGQNAALNVFGYSFVRSEGRVYTSKQPGTVPLELYWSEKFQDNATIATAKSKKTVLAAGYEKKATEGYIYPDKRPGTVPLRLYYNPKIKDYYSTTPETGEKAAIAAGYKFVRIEGYIFPLAGKLAGISGNWTLTMWGAGAEESVPLVIKANGGKLTVSCDHPTFKEMTGTGTLKGNAISFNLKSSSMEIGFTGKVDGNKMEGIRKIKGGGAPGGGRGGGQAGQGSPPGGQGAPSGGQRAPKGTAGQGAPKARTGQGGAQAQSSENWTAVKN